MIYFLYKIFIDILLNTFIIYLKIVGKEGVVNNNNLFIQRRFQVQKEPDSGLVNFIGSLYIAYYFYKNSELYVTKYALNVKLTKTEAQVRKLMNH